MSLIIPRVSLFDQIPLSGKVYLVSRLQDQPWIEAITNIKDTPNIYIFSCFSNLRFFEY